MHWASNLLPLTYVLRLLQDPWLALPWSLTDSAVLAAFALGARNRPRRAKCQMGSLSCNMPPRLMNG